MARKKKDRADELIDEMIKDRTPEELLGESGFLQELTKRFVERALEGKLTDHLGYEKGSADGNNTGNSRKGKSSKSVISSNGQMEIEVPRDRNGDFDPQLVKKRQRRLIGFDEKVIFLYAQVKAWGRSGNCDVSYPTSRECPNSRSDPQKFRPPEVPTPRSSTTDSMEMLQYTA